MTSKKTTTLLTTMCLGALLTVPAHAQDDMPAPGTPGGVVIPPENLVLPNAPKVGDTTTTRTTPPTSAAAPAAPTVAPNTPQVGDTSPGRFSTTKPDPTHGNPDWPCVQRKVLKLTSAQIWDGPPADDVKGWEDDDKIAELTRYLMSRRIPVEKVEQAIKDYAASIAEGERDEKLTELFASVLQATNKDRRFVMDRIEEFQRRQYARSKELEREGKQLAEMNQNIPPEDQLGPRDTKLTPEQQLYNWNARIFQERQQNLTVACEIPVLIDQRAYEVAQLIRAQMIE